jgi:hypothetical protein
MKNNLKIVYIDMGNASVKAHKRSGYGHKHRRSGHKRSGHGHKHKHNRFCTKRHHRYGGGLSPLNSDGKSKYISKPKTKQNGDMSLSKHVMLKEAYKSQRQGDAVRLKKTIAERERTARREQFFKDVEERERERAIRLKTRKTPIIHTHSTRTLKRK